MPSPPNLSPQDDGREQLRPPAQLDFVTATLKMLVQLQGAPLRTAEGLSFRQEILSEHFEKEDDRAAKNLDAALWNIRGLISCIRLPAGIQSALMHEDWQSCADRERKSPDPSEQRMAELLKVLMRNQPRPPVVNGYREEKDLINLVAIAGQNASVGVLEGARPQIALQGKEDIFPIVRLITPNLQFDFTYGENKIFQLYNYVPVSNGAYSINMAALKQGKADLIRAVNWELRILSGAVPESATEVQARFSGEFPVFLGEEVLSPDTQSVYARYRRLRIPFGEAESAREHLISRQIMIEQGTLKKYTLELSGRVSPAFLSWAYGEAPHRDGPIPDIEIIYSVKLPSDKVHSFVLKSARDYSQLPNQDVREYDEQDRFIVDHLGGYFLDASHRKNFDLLCRFNETDYPTELQHILRDPSAIDSIGVYRELGRCWELSQQRQLASSPGASDIYKLAERPAFTDYTDFVRGCLELLENLPKQQKAYPEQFFHLSEPELERVKQSYLPQLFRILQEEQARMRRECEDASWEGREALGYRGPREGVPLRLQYMLMDSIIDMRKQDSFREKRAQRDGVPPEAVVIPRHIGRRYDYRERFFGFHELPNRLSNALEQGKLLRKSEMLIYDPNSDLQGDSQLVPLAASERDVHAKITRENIARLAPEVKKYRRHSEAKLSMMMPIERRARAIFLGVYDELSKKIQLSIERGTVDRQEKGRRLAELAMALREKDGPLTPGTEQLQKLREDFDARIEREEKKLAVLERKLEILIAKFLPSQFRVNAIRFRGIRNTLQATLIYSIGSDGEPLLDIEWETRGGRTRATHSEQLGGRNMYAGGCLVVATHDQTFRSIDAWLKFDAEWKPPIECKWSLISIDNSSGHYEPPPSVLEYAWNIIGPRARQAGFNIDHCRVLDRFAPGIKLSWSGYA